jgi:hypothetical protein
MNLSETELTILNIIAEESHRSTSTDVFENTVIQESGLTPQEVYKIVNQLASLGLIEIPLGGRKLTRTFIGIPYWIRRINITKEGLNATRIVKVDDVFSVHTASVEETNEGRVWVRFSYKNGGGKYITQVLTKPISLKILKDKIGQIMEATMPSLTCK